MVFHKNLVGGDLHIAKSNSGAGTPAGSVSAGVIGELYWDTTNNKLYTAEATGTGDWVEVTGDSLTDPMTTRGDVIVRDASNDTSRLAVGTNGQVLGTDGTDVTWTSAGVGDVVGPGSAGDDNLVTFDSTTGKLIQDSGVDITAVTTNTSDIALKAPIADPTFTGEIGIGAVNVSETELGILEGATLTTTELNYVDGVTSAIQTQMDTKMGDLSDDTTPSLGGDLIGADKNITGLATVGFTQELDNGSKTTSFSVDFGTDQKQKVTLTANTMTLTLDTTFDRVGNYVLKIVNGGLATLTWASESGSIYWPGGDSPTLTSSGTDIVSFYYDGTNWYAVSSEDFS